LGPGTDAWRNRLDRPTNNRDESGIDITTVREAILDLFRKHSVTTWFGNPGSSELALLQDFPGDFRYFLGLQEMIPVASVFDNIAAPKDVAGYDTKRLLSWQMHAAAAYARLVRKPRTYRSARSAEAFLKQRKSCPEPPKQISAQRHHRLTHNRHGQFGCYTLNPSGEATPGRGSVVYVHGGGYVSEIHSAHWTLISDIANASNSAVHVPIYG
jgi:hypothetical protein